MMRKIFFAICCLTVLVFAEEKYTDKYDNINVEEILNNERLLIKYIDCLLDKGPCTPEGKELKDHIADALTTGCEKCTETQKSKTEVVIKHMVTKKPDSWKELCAKYDPTGRYSKKYEDLAKEHGIDLP